MHQPRDRCADRDRYQCSFFCGRDAGGIGDLGGRRLICIAFNFGSGGDEGVRGSDGSGCVEGAMRGLGAEA